MEALSHPVHGMARGTGHIHCAKVMDGRSIVSASCEGLTGKRDNRDNRHCRGLEGCRGGRGRHHFRWLRTYICIESEGKHQLSVKSNRRDRKTDVATYHGALEGGIHGGDQVDSKEANQAGHGKQPSADQHAGQGV